MDETLTLTVVCRHCGDRFPRPRRSSGRAAITYCSPACRQAAYRVRQDIQAGIPASARKRRPTRVRLTPRTAVTTAVTQAQKDPSATPLAGAVTRAEIRQRNHWVTTPFLKSLDPRIVPDAKWPGMFRIGLPGCLSDMANLTRIKDALRHGVRS